MDAEILRALQRAKPFRAFEVHDHAGQACTVTHPELMTVTPDGSLAIIASAPAQVAMVDGSCIASTTFPGARRTPIGPEDDAAG